MEHTKDFPPPTVPLSLSLNPSLSLTAYLPERKQYEQTEIRQDSGKGQSQKRAHDFAHFV